MTGVRTAASEASRPTRRATFLLSWPVPLATGRVALDNEALKIAHRGLKRLFERGDSRRLYPAHLRRIRRVLADLAVASSPRDLDQPGYRLHQLKGRRQGLWSVRISGNWRIIFRFVDGEAMDVDLIDYH